ncbi:MAG: ATP-dependent Clp protease ATP-binding subunit [Clostridiales bacterium]|nr:ATP-dependent Clp protease ATP-binding subunit [Clostridiales bacterium]
MYNLTDLANKCLQVASQFAAHRTNEVGTEHILYALSKVESKSKKLLQAYRVSPDIIQEILNNVGSGGIPSSVVELTPRVKEMLMIANSVAKKTHSAYISTEHLLVAMLSQDDSFAINILAGVLKLNVYEMRNKAISIINNANDSSFDTDGFVQVGNLKNHEQKNPQASKQDAYVSELPQELLDMGSDLTLRAKNGKIDPIIGRDSEIERMIEILCRKTKNNPVLIGEAGVGKTAVVEGLARRIVSGDVPALLKNKTIYSLDIGGLMAGTKYRGSMEEKLKNAIEMITSNRDIIVFIDEIHTLAQVGSDKGETNPADMLKPYLARGEMQTIGATTTDEYRKYIEKDKALERRFQPITVDPPTVEQTIAILTGLKDSYEAFHKVKITDEAIKAAATLSDRYIQDRSLPDKAIDLIDEASSRAKVKTNYDSTEIKSLKAKLVKLEAEKEDAVNQEDFEKAGKLRDKITQIKDEIDRQKSLPVSADQTNAVITENDVAEVISKWTNIPLTKLTEGEAEKLLNLEKTLTERVKGQDEAVEKVAKAIRRSRIGIRDPKRPIGSFLFLGPTGVGKTELSKALAEALFDDENKIIRLDMSEFMEAHSVSKLIGSPPGYVGFDDGGQLTEQVRRKPYSVVLFDEIEKAHPEVFNMLLQILDDGRLTDSHGKIVSFKNTIIILTSNIGSDKLNKKNVSLGFNEKNDDEDKSQMMLSELKKYFKPEIINRIDNIVNFNRLSPQVLKDIAKKMLADLNKNLKQSGVELKFTTSTLNYLVKNGTNDDFGARPMKRLITSKIEDELADRMLRGEILKGNIVLVDCKENKLIFLTKPSE